MISEYGHSALWYFNTVHTNMQISASWCLLWEPLMISL